MCARGLAGARELAGGLSRNGLLPCAARSAGVRRALLASLGLGRSVGGAEPAGCGRVDVASGPVNERRRSGDDWSNGRRLGKIALGDVTERPKVLASKARVGKPTGGSNPSITAERSPAAVRGFSHSPPYCRRERRPGHHPREPRGPGRPLPTWRIALAWPAGPVLDGLMPKLTNAAATASSGSVSPASCPPSEGPVDSVPPCGASRPRASRVCWPTRC